MSSSRDLTDLEKVEGMVKVRNEIARRWKLSIFYKEQKQWFETTIFPLKNTNLDNALCMGTSSLQGREGSSWKFDEYYNGAKCYTMGGIHNLTQFVAFECWVEILRTKYKIPDKRVCFQEPDYTDVDKLFITRLGFTVIESREAEERVPDLNKRVSDSTFLFSCYLYKDVSAILFAQGRPSLAVMSPLWVDSWDIWLNLSHPSRTVTLSQSRMRSITKRPTRDFVKNRLTRKLGPFMPNDPTYGFERTSIEQRMAWMADCEWYWKPDSTGQLLPLKEPLPVRDWQALPGPTGIIYNEYMLVPAGPYNWSPISEGPEPDLDEVPTLDLYEDLRDLITPYHAQRG